MTDSHAILEPGKLYRFNPPDKRLMREPIFPDLECQEGEQKVYINKGDIVLVVNQTRVPNVKGDCDVVSYCSTKIILGDLIGYIWEYVGTKHLSKNFTESFKKVSPEEVFE